FKGTEFLSLTSTVQLFAAFTERFMLLSTPNATESTSHFLILTYVVSAIVLSSATFALARTLGVSRPAAAVAASLLLLLSEPYLGWPRLYIILSIVPNLGTLISGFCVLSATVYAFVREGATNGRKRFWRSALSISFIVVLIIWLVAAMPTA